MNISHVHTGFLQSRNLSIIPTKEVKRAQQAGAFSSLGYYVTRVTHRVEVRQEAAKHRQHDA